MPAAVLLHLPPHYRRDFAARPPEMFYRRLADEFEARGVQVTVVPREAKAWQSIEEDGNLHIVENGDLQRPNVLNATVAYLQGFWHLDPRGVLCDSSIGQKTYDPAKVAGSAARPFARDLRARFVRARASRYRQSRARTKVAEGAIAVFLQGASAMTDRARLCPTEDMLRAVAEGAEGRPVYVKSHPLNRDPDEEACVAQLIREGFDLRMTAANVHDLLAPAAMSVSINSAVAMEGFLHGTPAVIFGKTDFHHVADCVRPAYGFRMARDAALARTTRYGLYLYWYFKQHCLTPSQPDFFDQVLARTSALGFPPERFGFDAVPTTV